ncbi:hypothetical protein LF1_27370 [Rubripirellula obstinata]|uniref:PEP-CTERM protein-sorting domain-containing protein n=3 Tax=Rubripirellula obstinata TaxID=406547 RepID=A0A5B1CG85_9BACT|nr:hypothetical protein LF1_27370 [Rubripirellula obstinata]
MMTRMLTIAGAVILIFGMLPSDAKAALTVGFDMDTSTFPTETTDVSNFSALEIETTRTVSNGEVFDVAVYLYLDSGTYGPGAPFSVDVTYNTDHLIVNEMQSNFTIDGPRPLRPAVWSQGLMNPLSFSSGGTGERSGLISSFFDENDLNNEGSPLFAWLGVLQFEAVNLSTTATDDAGLTLLGFQGETNVTLSAPSVSSLVVSAVPEPTAVWVCASIGFGARLSRRRRRV